MGDGESHWESGGCQVEMRSGKLLIIAWKNIVKSMVKTM